MRILFLTFLLSALFFSIKGQKRDSSSSLPFAISKLKKLAKDELDNKKEGTYITGIPDISVDPINGFGYGAEGSIIFNGKKSNPFFEYTPYLTKLDITLFNTSNNQRELIITIDKPYMFHTKWRLRGELAYEINPNLLYFGLTQSTLSSLAEISASDNLNNASFTGNSYNDYENNLSETNKLFNTYTKQEYILNISGEYSLLDSKMRVLIGAEVAGLNITANSVSNSRLTNDQLNNDLLGMGKSTITFLQAGIVYDTRDFEPDPNQGIFAEITDEFSTSFLGSDYNLNKIFGQIKWYKKLFPKKVKKFIFASRAGIGYTFGAAPFFEYQDEWSSEGSIEGLGGAHTLRGFKQSRFLDRGMYFLNSELRYRFLQFKLLKQNIGLSAVPFFDAGSVYHDFKDLMSNSIKNSQGIGVRVAWNLSTILRFDYAISNEDRQFFFIFEHAF